MEPTVELNPYSREELVAILNGRLESKENLESEIAESRVEIHNYCLKHNIGIPAPFLLEGRLESQIDEEGVPQNKLIVRLEVHALEAALEKTSFQDFGRWADNVVNQGLDNVGSRELSVKLPNDLAFRLKETQSANLIKSNEVQPITEPLLKIKVEKDFLAITEEALFG